MKNLLEYLSFSEEVDFYLHSKEAVEGGVSEALELLEGVNKHKRRSGAAALLYSAVKRYPKEVWVNDLQSTCREILNLGGLSVVSNYLSLVVKQIQPSERNLALEQELRTSLNIFYFVLCSLPCEELRTELSLDNYKVEDNLLELIKLSMELSHIPVKKVSMLLYKYLEIILKPFPEEPIPHLPENIAVEVPRHKLTPNNSVEAFYRRMVWRGNSIPETLVVGLLRAVLSWFPNSSTTGVVLKQEWLSPLFLYEENFECFVDLERQFDCDCENCDEEGHPHESQRHVLITFVYISKVFEILLKAFKLNHKVQFYYLSQSIYEANGVLVFLKLMNQEFKLEHYEKLNLTGTLKELLESVLKVTYKVCKNNPERIKSNLVHVKSALILKKIISKFPEQTIETLSLKLIRIQVKYLPKKWKSQVSNMKVISAIYNKLPPVSEDWVNENQDSETTEEEIRKLTQQFNKHHYWDGLEARGRESPELPEDFQNNYEEWLEENVWGMGYLC